MSSILFFNPCALTCQSATWSTLQTLNSRAIYRQVDLFALPLPCALIPIPAIPPPPAPGAPLNHPPAGLPAAPPASTPHAAFPATKAQLDDLSGPQLNVLLVAYNVPGFMPSLEIAQKRNMFGRFIGVRLD